MALPDHPLPTAGKDWTTIGSFVPAPPENLRPPRRVKHEKLIALGVGVDDPAQEDVGSVSFSGVDSGVIVLRWLPDAETVSRLGPPYDGRQFVVIPVARQLAPQYQEVLREELQRTPYQGLLPKT